MRFFAVPGEAERAGFRPCRRCRPGEGPRRAEAVRLACGYLESHIDEAPTLNDLAREVGMSPWHLHRTFKAALGLSPKEYAARLRAGRFKDEVRGGESVAGATYGAGYGSSSRLYEKAGENLGMTPGAYRRGGRGMSIRYTVADSPFGRLLVAATDGGSAPSASVGDARTRRWKPSCAVSTPTLRSSATTRRSARGSTPCCRPWRERPGRRAPSGPPGHGLPVARLEGPPGDPPRRDALLWRGRRGAGPAESGARRGPGLRQQPGGAGRPLPPRRPRRRRPRRLPLGRRAQAADPRPRSQVSALPA